MHNYAGVVASEEWFYGTGSTIAGGAYSFSVKFEASGHRNAAVGTFRFFDKEEKGDWLWHYIRPATHEECARVTSVWQLESPHASVNNSSANSNSLELN